MQASQPFPLEIAACFRLPENAGQAETRYNAACRTAPNGLSFPFSKE
ncbi:tRNA-dihydrouridine synthase A [Neisseria shayeganii 871]|uniref:tRNA-dihydrouridine synthase A n=1 Tax=Neisseria shayeganii 871 TaxID=1032488 RepID=G4CEZ1_9NEIS|nr:tRNA-dihydrouridine synthase A [Neisseria shayeganii 871]